MELTATFTPDLIVAFISLFILELVLGIYNVIFLSILASKLPKDQQARARNTAVGMVDNIWVIATAVVVSFGVMLFASKHIFRFVNAHPTVKMLALAFLVMVGGFLVIEGLGIHVNKAVIYTAMAFAIAVEALNLMVAARRKRAGTSSAPVAFRPEYPEVVETAAILAATTSGSGSVTLSSRPVQGDAPTGISEGRRGMG